ncbi:MAG: substrate-binding domain-containing protein [Akkermansiaceae bacterium]|jgi:LacI family transcriptional regulator|nr:substrate-binding domain-containing protein [Akkermansiaceae bacterium]
MRHVIPDPSRPRRIAVVQSSVNVRRLTPGFAPFAGMGYDFWIIDLFRQRDLLLASLREWRPSAIVTEYLEGLTEALLELGCPVVLVPSDQPVKGAHHVDIDDLAIGRLAAEHLVARGYTKFAFVGRGDAHYAKQRLKGFQSVVGEVPVYWEEFRDWRQYDEYWRDPDEDMVGWLAQQATPLGIFSAHDPTGRHVLEAAAQAGLEVPFAVGVISANDDETVCEMARPALSSIKLPWRRLAADVVQLLEAVWAGSPPAGPLLEQPLEIVARGSSSYEAVGDPVVRRAMQMLVEGIANIASVEEWAARVGVSRRVLERRFQTSLGRSPHAMMLHERIERAKKLLTSSDLPVSLIAERCGFQSNERLTVNFRELVGVPPVMFRRGGKG